MANRTLLDAGSYYVACSFSAPQFDDYKTVHEQVAQNRTLARPKLSSKFSKGKQLSTTESIARPLSVYGISCE